MVIRLADFARTRLRKWMSRSCAAVGISTAVALMFAATTSFAANYPLELVSPRQAGTPPAPGFEVIPAGHRIFKAHPGIPYNIRAIVIGGAYPFTYTLSNAPSGMSINGSTGEINWPSPAGNAVTPTISVVDAEGTRVSSPWTITVSTEGFRFISPTGNDSAAGTVDAPWRTLLKLYNSTTSSDIVYFRSGTYTADGIPRTSVGTAWERVEFGTDRSARWLAYPGETPVINFGYVAGGDPGVLIRFHASAANPVYLDGIEGRNFRNIGFQVVSSASNFTVLRRLKVHDMVQGVDGENPGGIMFTSGYWDASEYTAVQDSEFYRLNAGGALKLYSQKKMVIEDNVFRDSTYGFDLKSHMPRFDVRGNRFANVSSMVLYGNMHSSPETNEAATGEIRFNNINTPSASVSLDINQDAMAREVYIYRNTLVGRVQVRFADSQDGPFTFSNNIIINNDTNTPQNAHVVFYSVTDPSRIVLRDNLSGAPSAGIVDANGFLTANYARYLGTHGHQLGEPPERPNPPSGVVVE